MNTNKLTNRFVISVNGIKNKTTNEFVNKKGERFIYNQYVIGLLIYEIKILQILN